MNSFSGGDAEVESEKACVVYEAKTGRIVHLHRVITLRGGKAPTESAIEAKALQLAGERSKAALKALHIDSKSVQSERAYAVDLKKLQLVESPRSTTASSGASRKARK
jgi:hypothetical protein